MAATLAEGRVFPGALRRVAGVPTAWSIRAGGVGKDALRSKEISMGYGPFYGIVRCNYRNYT